MSFRFILGRAGSGKTHYCLTELAKLIKEDPFGRDLVFIVPEQATFIHERMLATDLDIGCFSRVDVTSFSRLAYRAAKEFGRPKMPQLTRTGKLMVFAKILQDKIDDLSVFSSHTLKSGITASLLDAVEEIRQYDRYGSGLDEAISVLQESEGISHFLSKLKDISVLFREMEAFLNNGFTDQADSLVFLNEAITEKGFLNGATIFIDGFANFHPQEKAVITALAQKASRVELALALDPAQKDLELQQVDLFYPVFDTCRDLSAGLGKHPINMLEPLLLGCVPGRFSGNEELTFLEKNFYIRGKKANWPQKPRNIKINAAPDKRGEIDIISREILRLVREEGYRYREIGVIARDADIYENLLSEKFKEAGIPFFIDNKKKLIYHPLLQSVSAALEVVGEGWHYHTVFRYLKSGLVPVTMEEVDKLENYCLAAGIRPHHWLMDGDWNFWPLSLGEKTPDEEYKKAELATINDIRRRGVEALASFGVSIKDQNTVSGFITQLRLFLQELKTDEILEKWAKTALENGNGEEALLHRKAYQGLDGLLREAEAYLGDVSLPLDGLRSLLSAGLNELTLSLIPVGLDQVFIASIERSRSPELRVCFLFDLNLGQFPAKIDSSGLISESERARLKEAGLPLAPPVKERQLAEAFLLYLALTRASERLYLSYSLTKTDGSPSLPSAVIAHIKSLFPFLKEEMPVSDKNIHLLKSGAGGLIDLSRMMGKIKTGEAEAYWFKVLEWYKDKPEYTGILADMDKWLNPQAGRSALGESSIRGLFGETLRSSVSRLEKFRDCPFAYFATYGMKIGKRRIYQLSAPDKGQLFHQVLADIGRKIDGGNLDWPDIDKDKAAELVDDSLAVYLPRFLGDIMSSSPRYRYLAERLRTTLVQSLLFWVEHMKRGSYRPVAWEMSFGPRGDWPALVLPLPDGRKLEVSGQIDRIDIAQKDRKVWLRVIDYKSGNENLTVRDIEEGLKLQLFVYLLVAKKNIASLGYQEAKAAGVYYSLVRDDMYSYREIPSVDNDQIGFLSCLKLKGLTVADLEAVRLADHDLSGTSNLIPIGIKEDGTFYKKQSGVAPEQWAVLQNHISGFLLSTAEALFSGMMTAKPNNRKDKNVCDYCDYKAFCGLEGEFAREEAGLISGGGETDE